MPELSRTPQANQMADDKLSASSSVFSALARRKRPAKHKKKKKIIQFHSRERSDLLVPMDLSVELTERREPVQEV